MSLAFKSSSLFSNEHLVKLPIQSELFSSKNSSKSELFSSSKGYGAVTSSALSTCPAGRLYNLTEIAFVLLHFLYQ